MEIQKQYYKNRGELLVKNLKKRNMAAEYHENSADAVKSIINLIPSGSTVSWGGSVSMVETGLIDALKNADLQLIDRSAAVTAEEISEIYHKALSCDYFIMSSNAISMDGQLVNIDGRGNRLAALIYGPENVIVVAGMNKVVDNVHEAASRVSNVAAPQNAGRLERDTPCAATGRCSDCQSLDCICCNTVITRRSIVKDRIKVFLVGENLGY